MFYSVFVEDASQAEIRYMTFIFLADDVFHKTSARASGFAHLARVFPKNTWLGGVDVGRQLRRARGSRDLCLAQNGSRLSEHVLPPPRAMLTSHRPRAGARRVNFVSRREGLSGGAGRKRRQC